MQMTRDFRQPPQVSSPNIMIVFDDSGSMGTNVKNQRIEFSEFTPPDPSSETVSSSSYSSDYLYFSLKNEDAPRSDDKNRRIEASKFCTQGSAPADGEKKTIDLVTFINQNGKERSLSKYKPKRFTKLNCDSGASIIAWRSEDVIFYSASYLNNLFDQSVADNSSGPYLYWSTDGTVPTWNSSQRFNASLNRCASAIDALYGDDKVGLFSTIGLGGYGPSINGQVNAWRSLGEIPSDSLLHVDCSNDYVNELTGWDSSTSGIAADTGAEGYPQRTIKRLIRLPVPRRRLPLLALQHCIPRPLFTGITRTLRKTKRTRASKLHRTLLIHWFAVVTATLGCHF